jgi:hypothetical protein
MRLFGFTGDKMSGVLNEFDAISVRYSVEHKTVYITGQYIRRSIFNYNILCMHKTVDGKPNIIFFFDLPTSRCLVVQRVYNYVGISQTDRLSFKCSLINFYVEEDLPVLPVRIFDKQKDLMLLIGEDFKQQHAAIMLDDIINS